MISRVFDVGDAGGLASRGIMHVSLRRSLHEVLVVSLTVAGPADPEKKGGGL